MLTEKVEENLGLIRSKFSNNVTNAKNAAWLEITEAVNAVGVAYRTVQEVRDKWKNLTSTAKKDFSDFGKEQRKTGGAPAPKKPSNATAKIIEIFKETPSFDGLSGFETNPGKLKFKILQFVLCSLRAKSRRQASGVKLMQNFSLLLNAVLSPAEADTADQDQPNLSTVQDSIIERCDET